MSLDNNKRCTLPVIRDVDGCCDRLRGGVIGPSVPSITVQITNPVSLIWTDENLVPVQTEEGDIILLDNV